MRSTLLLALFSAFLLAACGGGGGGGEDSAPSTPVFGQNGSVDINTVAMDAAQGCGNSRAAQELLAEINARRAAGEKCGATMMPPVPALTWNVLLSAASAGHSSDMASKNYVSHTGSNGNGAYERAMATGYKFTALGEVLTAGSNDPKRAVAAYIDSEPHCRGLMDATYKEVGGACVSNSSSQYKHYWTVMLGR